MSKLMNFLDIQNASLYNSSAFSSSLSKPLSSLDDVWVWKGAFLRPFLGGTVEIKVSEIPAEGFKIEMAAEAAEFVGLGEEIGLLNPVTASLRVEKVGATVHIKGGIDTVVELSCSRCAKNYEYRVASRLDLDLNPLSGVSEEEKELQAGDLDVEFYEDDIIDITNLLREQVLLQVPMKPLCSEDCLGLCPYCGQDMNEQTCGCKPPEGHPGFEALKDFLKDKG